MAATLVMCVAISPCNVKNDTVKKSSHVM